MALQSQLFRGDAKLEAAAVSDPAHILPGARGPHVDKIQAALIQLDGAGIAQDAAYGPGTAAAVRAFKQKRQILNFQGKIDDIVGKKTMAALDTEMLAREQVVGAGAGGAGAGGAGASGVVRRGVNSLGGTTAPVAVSLPLDILVQFDGGDTSAEGTRNFQAEDNFKKEINTAAYLQTHQPVVPFIFVGGRGLTDQSSSAFLQVLALRQLFKNGVTIVVGGSVGALPALRAAEKLSFAKIKLDYVGIADGAFFESLGEVSLFGSFPPRVILPGDIVADRKENFFQTFGHNTLKDPRGPGGFMLGTEFHLPLSNFFTNIDMALSDAMVPVIFKFAITPFASSLPVRARKILFADPAHQAAGNASEILIQKEVRKRIKP